MLVLTRRAGDSIIANESDKEITVTVLEIEGGRVKLGVSAPQEVPIHRVEVLERERNDE